MSPSGLGGNLTDVDRRTSPVGSCSPGRNLGGQFGDKDASPRAVAFSSGRVLSWLSTGTDRWCGRLGVRNSGDSFSLDAIHMILSAVTDGYAVEPNDMIFRRTSLHSENVSAGRDEIDSFSNIDCAAVKLRLPWRDNSAERDDNYVSPEIDSAAVELIDLCFRRLRLPPEDLCRRMGYCRG